ncbi:MAG TPA: N-acetylmuramoyl-L-alanine amidase, partial [Kofleriaceae bacterium]|nr:N-acetylmuramoyl-L-alanine amidase [Kofleriaceae bacterium]
MSTLGRERLAGLVCILLCAACVGDIEGPAGDPGETDDQDTTPYGIDGSFRTAGESVDVPAALLEAIGFVETRWQMVAGADEHDGQGAAAGIMGLRGARLTEAADLAGVDAALAATDVDANLAAAAALLSLRADELGIDRTDLGAWAPAVAGFSGIDDEEARRSYVADVYGVLTSGATVVGESGEPVATLAPVAVTPDYPAPGVLYAGTTDYPSAIWRPSPNYSSRPSGSAGAVAMVIIHTCEGAYAGCWGWLKNSASGVSAHYVVKEDGSEITQLVREASKAWHIAATYACSRNDNVECDRNGSGSNNFTVGIEHAGFESQSSFPAGQIAASARLTCDITRDHGIVRDRYHIVGHGQLQPWNRIDPGPNWPWSQYIDLVRSSCGDGGVSFWFYLPAAASRTVD